MATPPPPSHQHPEIPCQPVPQSAPATQTLLLRLLLLVLGLLSSPAASKGVTPPGLTVTQPKSRRGFAFKNQVQSLHFLVIHLTIPECACLYNQKV